MPNRRNPFMDAAAGAAGTASQYLMSESQCQKELDDLRQENEILRAVCGNLGGSGMPRGASMFQPGFNTPQYGAPSDAGNLFGQLGQMQAGGPATPPWNPNIPPNWLGSGLKGQF